MKRSWRVILLGPADLERSIIDSALRQAGFELAVLNRFADLSAAMDVDGLHGIIVTGDHVGRESEVFDLSEEIIRPAKRSDLAVLLLRDENDDSPLPEGTVGFSRPLKFPASAAKIVAALEAHQQAGLEDLSDLATSSLRSDLSRASSSSFSGVLVVDTPEAPGQIHFRGGELTLIVCGGLTGAEALCVLLAARQGTYRFDRQQSPQGEDPKPLAALIGEADALELRTAEMLQRAPHGALETDPLRLLSRLNRLSDNVAWIFRLIDGKRDMRSLWKMGGTRAVEGALSLIEDGILLAQRGSSRVLAAAPEEQEQTEEPGSPSAPPQLEEDFAWSLAVKGVTGLSAVSLKEEGWGVSEPGDWDQLPDLDAGIEGALSDAQSFFKTQVPSTASSPGIEPLLAQDDVVLSEDPGEFDAPPVLSDEEIFSEDGEPPPISDEDLPPISDEDLPPPIDSGFEQGAPARARAIDDSDLPYEIKGTGSFGHDDEITADDSDLEVDEESVAARKILIKRMRFIATVVILFGSAAYTTYLYSQRIRNTTRGKVERAIAWDPSMKEVAPKAKKKPESLPPVAVVDAGPASSLKKKRRKKRRRRRVRKARRSRLSQGEFAKRMQGARMLRDDGNLEGAVQLIGLALRLKVSAAERSVALSERGEAHFSAGDTAKAIEDLRQSVTLDQSNQFALKTLGLIEYQNFKSGDASARDRARDMLLKYRKISGRRDAAVARWLAELE